MPSRALREWVTVRAASLDEIEQAHQSVGGTGPGRRMATQQINQAYAVLLSGQFQGFCRELYTEALDFFVRAITPVGVQVTVREEFVRNLKLDRGNPNPGNLGADFGRLGVAFWPDVDGLDGRNRQRRVLLEELNEWRNAIAHQDFDPNRLGGRTTLQLAQVRGWRGACNGLALCFDQVMRLFLAGSLGRNPW